MQHAEEDVAVKIGTKKIAVIGHRGAAAYAPENTLVSFRQAHEMAADYFELDCRLTADGEVVCLHDSTLDRTTNGVGLLSEVPLAAVKRLDAGSWFAPEFAGEAVPTLGEALDFAKGRIGVYIEVKNDDDDTELLARMAERYRPVARPLDAYELTELVELISASGTRNLELARKTITEVRTRCMEQQVVVQSFSPVICAVVRAEAPDLRCELLWSACEDDPACWAEFHHTARLLSVAGMNPGHKGLTPERVAEVHAQDRTIAAYTINDEPGMHQAMRLGIDAIITDRPDVALQMLKANGLR
jgi:glycerophosphoryl diester phosphodiesterase